MDSSAVAGVLMMDPGVNNSWIGKLLTARTNAKIELSNNDMP